MAACEKRYRSIFSPATTAQRVFPANSKEASVARGRKGSVQVFSAAHTDLACQRQGRNLSLWRPVKFRPPLLCTRFKPFALLTYTGHHLHVIYDSINVTNELNLPHLCYLKFWIRWYWKKIKFQEYKAIFSNYLFTVPVQTSDTSLWNICCCLVEFNWLIHDSLMDFNEFLIGIIIFNPLFIGILFYCFNSQINSNFT